MASYPARAGYYDKNELFRLSSSVGFPGNFLAEGLESAPGSQLQAAYQRLSSNRTVSDRVIQDLLKSKHLYPKLEKIFNKYPADYNRKVFMKALSLLRHKRLGFAEISDARLSFELYMSEDGGGMLATTSTVLQALKMLSRVMSPMRLESEIQKQQAIVDFPPRIQMYEFMDLVIKSVHYSEVEREMACESVNASDSNMLPDFRQLLMTKEERLLAHLDQQYRNSLYRKVDSMPPISDATKTRTISTSPRENARADSERQRRALTPSLQYSQHQLFKARNGRMVFTPVQHQAVELRQTNSRAGTRCGTSYRQSCGTPVFPKRAPQDLTHSPQMSFLTKSKSVPLLPSLHRHGDKTSTPEMAVEDLGDTISKVCEKSVYSASHALRMSMTSVSQLKLREEEEVQDSEPVHSDCDETARAGTAKRSIKPVVTELEIARHQGLIDNLEWIELRRKWHQPSNKFRTRSRTFI